MKYKIADLIAEFTPKYDNLKNLAAKFEYSGSRKTDITVSCTDEEISSILNRMVEGTDIGTAENYLYSVKFNRRIIRFGAMLVHSSAISCGGTALLFSADSGVGKSTHTRMWKEEFSDVTYINDDKPIVKIENGAAVAFGSPFDGGSGVANNISAPLGAIIFVERAEKPALRKAEQGEIIQRLYFQTAHFVGRNTAEIMLQNFEALINSTPFYIMQCNENKESAHAAREFLEEQNII